VLPCAYESRPRDAKQTELDLRERYWYNKQYYWYNTENIQALDSLVRYATSPILV